MKRKIKVLIDIAMTILFILLMAYHLLPDQIHEWIGVSLFILFIAHNVLNIKWYKMLFKGKYRSVRIIQTIINFALLISMLCCIFSSLLISGHIFTFISINKMQLGRSLHLASTMWSFVLMSFHLGLHWSMFVNSIKKRISPASLLSKIFQYLSIVLVIILSIIGIYTIVVRKIWEELFLLTEFKWFDYEKMLLLYIFENITIVIFLASLTYYFKKLIIKISVSKNKKDNVRL